MGVRTIYLPMALCGGNCSYCLLGAAGDRLSGGISTTEEVKEPFQSDPRLVIGPGYRAVS